MSLLASSAPKLLQSCLSTSWGGLEMVALENALALTKNNFKCYTLCVAGSPLEKHLKAQGLATLSLGARRSFRDVFTVRRFIEGQGIEILLVQLLRDLRLLALSLFKIPKRPRIYGISHTFVNVNKRDFLHRWVYHKVHKLICLTEAQKRNLLEHLPVQENQLTVLPNYVDCTRFHPRHRSLEVRKSLGGEEGKTLIGITSRLDPQKGQNIALQAMAQLKEKNLPLKLVIVGENTHNETNYLGVLKAMAKELHLEKEVYFAGYRPDMESVVASLDVLVMPSRFETFGRVLIEAMAAKTPVIATRGGGVPDIIENEVEGLLVAPENAAELAAAMERLTLDEALRGRLASAAYNKVQTHYSKEVVEHHLLELLQTPSPEITSP